jgi:hypothetical protein
MPEQSTAETAPVGPNRATWTLTENLLSVIVDQLAVISARLAPPELPPRDS